MKPHTKTNTVVTTGVTAQAFTIKASGKAFRILIDGIYADKIKAPVRELMSNAWDAHAEARNTHTPFEVIVPTSMDPTFGVRDYGTGMTHDQVMGLYTTLFDSSRESSNDSVGMLGLGSKSPFAYTDTFTVNAFDGKEKRTYMAYVEGDVPMIALVGTMDSTEHKGIEVRFPVQQSDVRSFVDAVRIVSLGFDVLPKFDTDASITMPETKMQGKTWKLYPSSEMPGGGYSRQDHMIRQGCVLYPVPDSRYDNSIPYGMVLVVDVPIGTVDVATSRESLAFDDQTKAAVTQAFKTAWDEAKETVVDEYKRQGDQYDRLKYAAGLSSEWRALLPQDARRQVFEFMPNTTAEAKSEAVDKYKPGHFVMDSKKGVVTEIPFHLLENATFILDNPDVVRRRSRIVEAGRYNNSLYVIPIEMDHDKAIRIMKRTMRLKDSQFVKVKDLDDDHTPGTAKARTKLSVKRDAIDNGSLWVIRARSIHKMPGTTFDDTNDLQMGMTHGDVADLLDNDSWREELVFLTPKEYEKIDPPMDQSYGKIVLEAAVAQFKDRLLVEFRTDRMQTLLRQHAVTWETGSALVNHIAPPIQSSLEVPWKVKSFLDENSSVDYAGVEAKCEVELEEARIKYPRLFNLHDWSIEEYINNQDQEYA